MSVNIDIATKADVNKKQDNMNKNLNTINLDTSLGNWVMATNDHTTGTRPVTNTQWVNILQMDSYHFQTQLGMWVSQGSKGPDGVKPAHPSEIFIRSKYHSDTEYSQWVQIVSHNLHINHSFSGADFTSDTDYNANIKTIANKITCGTGYSFYIGQDGDFSNLHKSLIKKLHDDGFTEILVSEALEVRIEAANHRNHPHIFDLMSNQTFKQFRFMADILGTDCRVSKAKCIFDGN